MLVKIISRTSLQLQKLAAARGKRWNPSEKSDSNIHSLVFKHHICLLSFNRKHKITMLVEFLHIKKLLYFPNKGFNVELKNACILYLSFFLVGCFELVLISLLREVLAPIYIYI